MMMIVGYTQPMIDVTQNRMELMNEAFTLLNTYHLYLLTDFMTNLENRALVGNMLVFVSILTIGLNLSLVVSRTMSLA